MKIFDMDGQEITVENLELAMMQADDYRHIRHTDPSYSTFDDKQQVYWNDVYQKLLALTQNQQADDNLS